ncbi:MAG: amino acid ABC transporter permease [Geminicoccaceae bacterium]
MRRQKTARARARPIFALACIAALLSGCSGSGWGWYVVSPATEQGRTNLAFLIGGMWDTILISLVSMALSIAVGLLVALPGLSERKLWRRVNIVYVEFVRAIPILVLILWVYYGLPVIAGIELDVFWAGVLALALSDSAVEAEIFRAGIPSLTNGQTEAAKSMGLSYMQTMRLVILPQAIRRILPPLGNQFAYMLKISALVSVIGMQELTRRANELVVTEYRPLEIYTVLILEYLVLILIVSQGVRWLERHMSRNER